MVATIQLTQAKRRLLHKHSVVCSSKIFAEHRALPKISDKAPESAGSGFLLVTYSVIFELIMGIPSKRQSVALGDSPVDKVSSVN